MQHIPLRSCSFWLPPVSSALILARECNWLARRMLITCVMWHSRTHAQISNEWPYCSSLFCAFVIHYSSYSISKLFTWFSGGVKQFRETKIMLDHSIANGQYGYSVVQHVPLCLCSLLAAISQFNAFTGRRMQLTGWEKCYNNMRNMTCADTQTSNKRPYCSFLYCGQIMEADMNLYSIQLALYYYYNYKLRQIKLNEVKLKEIM